MRALVRRLWTLGDLPLQRIKSALNGHDGSLRHHFCEIEDVSNEDASKLYPSKMFVQRNKGVPLKSLWDNQKFGCYISQTRSEGIKVLIRIMSCRWVFVSYSLSLVPRLAMNILTNVADCPEIISKSSCESTLEKTTVPREVPLFSLCSENFVPATIQYQEGLSKKNNIRCWQPIPATLQGFS